MAITARPRPVFCVFGVKKLRTFYFKLTEQSSRKKLAVGGFEPEKVRLLYPAPRKIPLLYDRQVATLKTFHEHGVITQAQHDKSLHDLTDKMGYADE